ncbi:TetR family transcriptional regulator [Promicromonospora thailandica]|uniref:Transcriptional regulator, TetR family n=1 Tax=Promicromonospora thailandica TaxID=765201 RepID=A0A9X2JUN8_9MICO|nr:TetR/AcrR family transcriptional regulator [Promicromonospora thailandica]MCP2263672.1 transcriptional regulator, TetR family [Promicromonospora thailandica]BFF19126.1 TetR family transcriptional regulator [Promicromonospora thailandica]
MADAAPAPRRGRRPAGQDARAEILAAARDEFVERGYEAASLRSVARRAGVDPGTVRHWFPDKPRLLTATLGVAGIEPAAVVERVTDGPVETLGERLLEAVIGLWDFDDGDTVRVVLPAIIADAELRGLLPQFIGAAILRPVVRALGTVDAPLRTSLVASQMAGVLMTRYLVRLEPLASLSPGEVARLVGPNLQRYLTGDLAS